MSLRRLKDCLTYLLDNAPEQSSSYRHILKSLLLPQRFVMFHARRYVLTR